MTRRSQSRDATRQQYHDEAYIGILLFGVRDFLSDFQAYYDTNHVPGLLSAHLANIHQLADLCTEYGLGEGWRKCGKYKELFDRTGGFYMASPSQAIISADRFTGYANQTRIDMRLCLGRNQHVSLSELIEGHRTWNKTFKTTLAGSCYEWH